MVKPAVVIRSVLLFYEGAMIANQEPGKLEITRATLHVDGSASLFLFLKHEDVKGAYI